jgi:glycosyltransferase involved in cell wall biosynthesis
MRVGVCVPKKPQEEGGGFTFENELFASLIKLADQTRHKFVLFYHGKNPVGPLPANRFETIRVRGLPLRRILAGFCRMINLFFNRVLLLPNPFPLEDWIDPFLFKHHISFFLNLTPDTYTKEVPYLTFVWDLQHRIQPFFPEVSADGRWVRREDKFAGLLKRASYVVVGTEAGKEEVREFYGIPDTRIRILPHPTPTFALTAGNQNKKPLPTSFDIPEGFLFYPAQFWPHKNHMTILLAMRLLRNKYSYRPHAVFVGSDCGNLDYVQTMAHELDLTDQIHVLGFVSRDHLIALYQNALVVVYASMFGPENLPPLEAFALGCPVVASKVSGSEEQLGDAALLVPPTDEMAFADAIYAIYSQPTLRASLIQKGRERALKFTGDDFARGIYAILDEFEEIRRGWSIKKPYRPVYSLKKLLYG